MINEIVHLAKQFISIPSTAGNKDALDEILELVAMNLEGFTLEKFTRNDVPSLLVYNTKTRPKKFTIILNAHLDVIPGKTSQYKPQVLKGKLYGVGAMDMKGSVACMLLAFKAVAQKVTYPLALQLVADEQSGGLCGTKYQIEKGVLADFVISGETTNFAIVNNAKGVLWLKITFTGKSAHGAYPWQGENALLKIQSFISDLQHIYPIPKKEVWSTTVTLSKVETSNIAFNKIPDDGSVWLDIRYANESKESILKNIKMLLPKGSKVHVVFEDPPISVSANNYYIQLLQSTALAFIKRGGALQHAHGTSDMTHYAKVGCVGVEFGAVGVKGNTTKEYIDIKSLEQYYQVLVNFLQEVK